MTFSLILILCNLATFILGILTIAYTVRLRKMRSIRWLLLLTVCFLIGSFGGMSIFITDRFEDRIFFFYVRAWGTLFVPAFWLYFISAVFDRWNWLHKRWVVVAVLAPCVLNFLMALFPASRPFLFTDFQPLTYRGISVLQFKLGRWYGPFSLWSTILMISSYAISTVAFIQERGYRRRQVLLLNMGFGVALASYFLPNSKTLGWIMGSSLSILATQIGIMCALIWHRLLSVVPLAMAPVFQKLPDPVLVIDEQNRLMAANDKARNLFKLPEDFLGQPIEKQLPGILLTSGELVLTDNTQRPRHFHLTLEKIEGESDSSPGTVVFFRDIGPQKDVENRLNEGLEFRARLLALFAHDLTGYVENQSVLSQALQKKVSSDHRQQLELLASSAQASQNLVNNIMAWTKSQPMQFQPDRRPFEWNLLLRETIEQMQSRLSLKGVEVVFASSQNAIIGEGDSEMLAAALRNILSNSVRATPQGKKIYVSLKTSNEHVEIKVRDEGCGIETETLERIREASKEFLLEGIPKTHGAGIGLMIARHLISLHQGRFDIQSSLGVGTEVSFFIPL